MIRRKTIDDLLPGGRSDNFVIDQKKGSPRVLRNRKSIKQNPKNEMYLNETELKKAGIDFLRLLMNCKILFTDNMALRVGNGKKVKTRNPGMSDHHICLRGLFIAIEAKMPGKDLDPAQISYKAEILAAGGKFICYHSVAELQSEMIKLKLISRELI
jgi:hypothetical protein